MIELRLIEAPDFTRDNGAIQGKHCILQLQMRQIYIDYSNTNGPYTWSPWGNVHFVDTEDEGR